MNNVAKIRLSNPVHLLAVGFGSGLSAKAPGTVGTIAAIPFYLLLAQLNLTAYLAICVVTFVFGVYICGKTASDIGVHDHPAIVWDEFVGLFITMIAVPNGWLWLLVGFLLFRFFDIVKPWPIRYFDKNIHSGLGIMLDDLLAGLFSCITLHISFIAINNLTAVS